MPQTSKARDPRVDPLFVAMEDLGHVLLCGDLSDDCEYCTAAQQRLQQYRESRIGYPRPGDVYEVRTPKSKDPESVWVSGRRIVSVDVSHPKPIRYQQIGCKQAGRCTLMQWNHWVVSQKAEVINAAD